MSKEYIAKKLKEYREKNGISVNEIAERFGKSIKTIYSWESGQGQPDADTLIELCLLYGIDDFSILYESISETNYNKEVDPLDADEDSQKAYESIVEQKLKDMILSNYKSIREFSIKANIPYTTVDSILKRGVNNSNVLNVIKLCCALEIDVEKLTQGIVQKKEIRPSKEDERIFDVLITEPQHREFLIKASSLPKEKKEKLLSLVMELMSVSDD